MPTIGPEVTILNITASHPYYCHRFTVMPSHLRNKIKTNNFKKLKPKPKENLSTACEYQRVD